MKIQKSLIGAALGFLPASSCCRLPFLAAALGGAAGLSAFSAEWEKYGAWLMAGGIGLTGWAAWQFFQKRKTGRGGKVILGSLLRCPSCGFQKLEIMPTDACRYFYECENCRAMLKPKPGDCCVFCSYGSVKCPPVQEGGGCC